MHQLYSDAQSKSKPVYDTSDLIPAKPHVLIPNFMAIPPELKAEPSWVGWKLEYRPDQSKPWTKIPLNLRKGGKAMANNPATWAKFELAEQRFQEFGDGKGDMAGIGWCLHGDFLGIDLDNCRDRDTGTIQAWAGKIIERIGSYSEVSPSGTGVRIFCHGKLPVGGRKKTGRDHPNAIEIYDRTSPRYLTVTGHHIEGTPTSVQERYGEVLAFHADTFPPKVHAEKLAVAVEPTDASDLEVIRLATQHVGGKFSKLWEGNWKALGYESQSSADLALAGYLAFYIGNDPERIRTLFAQSGLYREKWDRADYSTNTITMALDKEEFFDWERHRRRIQEETIRKAEGELPGIIRPDPMTNQIAADLGVTVEQMEKATVQGRVEDRRNFVDANEVLNWPEPSWLIEGMLVENAFGTIYGVPGCFKTFLALDMALCLAHGLPFLGQFNVPSPVPVAYISPEGTSGLKNRLKAWMEAKGIGKLANTIINRHAFRLNEQEEAEAVITKVVSSGTKPRMLFIDTLARNFGGGDENSTKDMNTFVNNVMDIAARLNVGCVVVHHSGKEIAKGPRGSIALLGAVDLSISMEKIGTGATVRCLKQKDAAEFTPFFAEAVPMGPSLTLSFGGAPPVESAISNAITTTDLLPVVSKCLEPATRAVIEAASGIAHTTVHRYLKLAEDHGYIKRLPGRPAKWEATPEGKALIPG